MKGLGKGIGAGLLTLAFAMTGAVGDPSEIGPEKKGWILTGQPLEQLVRTDVRAFNAFNRHKGEKSIYLPDCDLLSFADNEKVTEQVKIDPTTSEEFESWMKDIWNARGGESPCTSQFCSREVEPAEADCNQYLVDNIGTYIHVQDIDGGKVIFSKDYITQKNEEIDRIRKEREQIQREKEALERQKEQDKKLSRQNSHRPLGRLGLTFGVSPSLAMKPRIMIYSERREPTREILNSIYHLNYPTIDIEGNYGDKDTEITNNDYKWNALATLRFKFMQVGTNMALDRTKYHLAYYYPKKSEVLFAWEENVDVERRIITADLVFDHNDGTSAISFTRYYAGIVYVMDTYDLDVNHIAGTLPQGYELSRDHAVQTKAGISGFRMGIGKAAHSEEKRLGLGLDAGFMIIYNSFDEPMTTYVRQSGVLSDPDLREIRKWTDYYLYGKINIEFTL